MTWDKEEEHEKYELFKEGPDQGNLNNTGKES